MRDTVVRFTRRVVARWDAELRRDAGERLHTGVHLTYDIVRLIQCGTNKPRSIHVLDYAGLPLTAPLSMAPWQGN